MYLKGVVAFSNPYISLLMLIKFVFAVSLFYGGFRNVVQEFE